MNSCAAVPELAFRLERLLAAQERIERRLHAVVVGAEGSVQQITPAVLTPPGAAQLQG